MFFFWFISFFLAFSWKRPWHFGCCHLNEINSIHQFRFEIMFLIKIFFFLSLCLFVAAKNALMTLCVLNIMAVSVCSHVHQALNEMYVRVAHVRIMCCHILWIISLHQFQALETHFILLFGAII